MIATIGYEKSTLDDFIATLKACGIEVLVDIRERAQSRRPGFSKTALSAAVNDAGIDYVHFRALGDPKAGRDAARAGMIDKFQKIFLNALATQAAQEALVQVGDLAVSKRICLMCYERDHQHCHRKIVSDHLEDSTGLQIIHLGVTCGHTNGHSKGRVFHPRQSATA